MSNTPNFTVKVTPEDKLLVQIAQQLYLNTILLTAGTLSSRAREVLVANDRMLRGIAGAIKDQTAFARGPAAQAAIKVAIESLETTISNTAKDRQLIGRGEEAALEVLRELIK